MFKALPILGAARVCVCVCVCVCTHAECVCVCSCICAHVCVWSGDYKWAVQRPSLSTGAWAPGLLFLRRNGLCSLVAKTACPGLILYRAEKPSSRQLGDSPQTEEQD